MRIVEENNKTYLYADEDKLLDFKEPHYVLNDDQSWLFVNNKIKLRKDSNLWIIQGLMHNN